MFGLEPRADLIARMVQLAARQAPRRVAPRRSAAPTSHRTGKKMYKQKGTGGARHGSARVPQFRGGGRAMGPVIRSFEHDLPQKVRALAMRHALSAKAQAGELIVWDNADLGEAKTKLLRGAFEKSSLANVLIVDGAEVEREFRARRPQPAEDRRAAGAGRQRLRHHAPREARADEGRGRSAGGAVQMSKDTRHYDLIVAPAHHREGDDRVEITTSIVFHVRREATKPQIKAAIEKLFDVKVTAVNTLDPQGQGQDVPRPSAAVSRTSRRRW